MFAYFMTTSLIRDATTVQMKMKLKLKRLGIDTYNENMLYIRYDCPVCVSEGFEAPARIRVIAEQGDSVVATLVFITSGLLECGEASLSENAWKLLKLKEGDEITLRHIKPLESLEFVHKKSYGQFLNACEISSIISDIRAGNYSDVHIASFLTACSGDHLIPEEMMDLTKSMVDVGERIKWKAPIVVDKHCVGGLAGNRTTPIVVAIVAEFGLTIPKTSSRAITSPAGTADTMEVFTRVDLNTHEMKKVVEKEGGCFIWGGSIGLSPVDDILLSIERTLGIENEGQLVASVLSKKIAAGSTHVVIDMPIGPHAKIKTRRIANRLKYFFTVVAEDLGIETKVVFTDGRQPVGRGIGPALEARDIVDVLTSNKPILKDLRERALLIAGHVIEFSDVVLPGQGRQIAQEILDSGRAWKKFQAICKAQGGEMKEIPKSNFQYEFTASKSGTITQLNNNLLARIAKLAGAPNEKVSGVDLHIKLGDKVDKGDALFTIHAGNKGEIDYALSYLKDQKKIVEVQ